MTAGLETLRSQVRWLARAMAASMVLMFLAVALPWLARMIEVELAALAWTLTAFAVTHAAIVIAADHVRSAVVMLRLLHAVPIVGVVFMVLLWHHGGGASHPTLALAMVLPVIAAAVLPRVRFAFYIAICAIVVVTAAVAITTADFGWYLTQLDIPGAGLLRLAGEELLTREPFPGATMTPAATFLFVVTFAVIQLAAALMTTRVVERVREREDVALRVQEPATDTLAATAMRMTPVAGVLVVAETGQIVHATKRFIQQMLLHNDPPTGRELLGVLEFADEDDVRTVLANGGGIASSRYRVGPEERVARISADTFEHEGTTYAAVVISDALQEHL